MKRDSLSFYEENKTKQPVAIVSVPFELGSDARGLADAPRYLFDNGLEQMLRASGLPITDFTAIDCPRPRTTGFPKYLKEAARVAHKTCDAVRDARTKRARAVVLCGDHASAIGSIAGAATAGERIGVIYIDAHPDIHTHETTTSGNVHAMVASSNMGFGHPLLTAVGGQTVKVQPEDFVYLGIKDFDAAEIDVLRASGARVVTMLDVALHGLSRAISEIDALQERVDTVWISMDLDSIDKQYAPGVAMPCSDGFTRREITSLAHYIGKACDVAGFDIVEILPKNDVEGKTAALAIELIARFLGVEYTWYRSYMKPYEITRAQAREAQRQRQRGEAVLQRWQESLQSLSHRR